MQMKLRSLPKILQEQSQLRGSNATASGLMSLRNALCHIIRMKRCIASVNGPQPGGINYLRLIAVYPVLHEHVRSLNKALVTYNAGDVVCKFRLTYARGTDPTLHITLRSSIAFTSRSDRSI